MLAGNDIRLIVSDYFLNADNFGKVRLDGDHLAGDPASNRHERSFPASGFGRTGSKPPA